MMAFITHYLKNARFNLLALLACVCLVGGMVLPARAQSPVVDISLLKIERAGDAILLTATAKFDLSAAVEDALLKGVAIFFVAEADVYRERWYWTNKRILSAERHLRLAYQPLTRRWRLNVASGMITNAGLGMALNQNFESLSDALAAVQRVSRWKIAEATEIDLQQPHTIEYRFRLDVTQLPRPLQIGTLGQSDWEISVVTRRPLAIESAK
jgi:hypothetical protein